MTDLLGRAFAPGEGALDTAWVGDITYLRTGQGWAYLATVIDLASRRVVGFAVAESFFATLKKELIHRASWPTVAAVRTAVFEYIEVFYNRRRLHSSLGYQTPAAYEMMAARPDAAPAA